MKRIRLPGSILPLFFFGLVCVVIPFAASAAPEAGSPAPQGEPENTSQDGVADATGNVPTLPPVTVVAIPEGRLTGKSMLTREQIENLPRGNGSVNELLDTLPAVQFGQKANTSLQGGEILPPNVSISGSKVFQNHFTIDGISNDSLLDPIHDNVETVNDLPGHPQKLFVDTGLVEEVQVFDSNIPVRFGGFTGGVVDAKVRAPSPEPQIQIGYRTTRHQWTEFHLDKEDEEEFNASKETESQPRFKKHDFVTTLDIPYSDRGGLLASFHTLQSKIPLQHMGRTQNQSRRRENYLLKVRHDLSPFDTLSFQTIATPSRDELFLKNTKGSNYTIERDNHLFSTSFTPLFGWGDLRLDAAYSASRTRRDAPQHFFQWAITPSRNWGEALGEKKSEEGGFGSIEKEEEALQLKADLLATEMTSGPLDHRVNIGLDYQQVKGVFDRKDETHFYIAPLKKDSLVCGENDVACVDGEQYFLIRNVYTAGASRARINLYGAYAEDLIRYHRLEVRPGLRLSYDDYTHNTDLAPRLTATYDCFGNGGTVLAAGMSRYYGKSLLTYKIREGIAPKRTDRRQLPFVVDNQPTDWEIGYKVSTTTNSYSELKTPYADEISVGLEQRLLGGQLGLQYVEREWNDEFARDIDIQRRDGKTYVNFTLNNNGSSRHQSYRASWQRQWSKHYLALNATYQETTTSNETYEDFVLLEDLEERVWYEGELIDKTDLPREDFNRSWVGNLTYSVKLPYGFTFTNFTKYRSGYKAIDRLADDERPAGIPADIVAYEEKRRPESWTFDWKLGWQKRMAREHSLLLTLEVNNVFNQKVPAGAEANTGEIEAYELGRQFWAGAEYRF